MLTYSNKYLQSYINNWTVHPWQEIGGDPSHLTFMTPSREVNGPSHFT